MENSSIVENLKSFIAGKFNNVEFDFTGDEVCLWLNSEEVHGLIEALKEDANLSFNFLTLIGGIHYPDNKGEELVVVYHLHSWKNNFRIRLKTKLSMEKPEIQSITDLFMGANWMERETFDFYGIQFTNHPDLRRILNEETMDYHPMLKQYALEDDTREDKDDRFFGRQKA
jgi:NADH-quinone oxidoreductase subunit C